MGLKSTSEPGQVYIVVTRLQSDTDKLLQVVDALTAKLSPILFQNEPESPNDEGKEAPRCSLASALSNESMKIKKAIKQIQRLSKDVQL
jgi:hypothetical protein